MSLSVAQYRRCGRVNFVRRYMLWEYAYNYITGMQGGIESEHLKIVCTAKHFAGYDLENYAHRSRLGYDAIITQ